MAGRKKVTGVLPHETLNILTDAATVTPEIAFGRLHSLTTASSRTMAAPLHLGIATTAGTITGMQLTFLITATGTITTTWNAAYVFVDPWADPPNGSTYSITFRATDGSTWQEVSRAPLVRQIQTLVDAAPVALNCVNGLYCLVPITTNRTLGTPTNPRKGMRLTLDLTATAAATLTLPAAFKATAATMVASAASKHTIASFNYNGTNWIEESRTVEFAA